MTEAGNSRFAAIVTGGGSGIGRATALAFCRDGYAVTAADVSEAGLSETLDLAGDLPGTIQAVRADVTSVADVDAMTRKAESTGIVRAAVNCAGIVGPGLALGEEDSSRLKDTSDEDWARVLAVNLTGVFHCVRSQMRSMWAEGGAIVNLASIAGMVGSAGLGPYVASKHGVVGLGKTAAIEGAPRGIRVNTICPGTVATPMLLGAYGDKPEDTATRDSATPLGRPGTPEELAAVSLWLCGDAASYLTGATIPVDGGTTSMNPRSGIAPGTNEG